jgi:hypothetical protein
MPDSKSRDWVDVIAKLLIPVVLALGGYIFTERQAADQRARQQLERDSGYIKLLVSDNDRERDLGLKIIDALQKNGDFSPMLVPVVQAVAQGRPSDPATRNAQNILAKVQAAQPTVGPAPPSSPEQRSRVYIQIAREDQRDDAQKLEQALNSGGYSAPGVELVQTPTRNTYIRYFSPSKKDQAEKVQQIMQQLGIAAAIQNFSNAQSASSPDLEVWLGASETGHITAPATP